MTLESNAWTAARGALAPFGVLGRVENAVAVGFPDVVYCIMGVSGLLEMKATVASLTAEQVAFGARWVASGGIWHMLLRADDAWRLYDVVGAARVLAREEPHPLVVSREFPLRDVLRALAPPGRRWTALRPVVGEEVRR
jgi:hypothetical protein